MNQYLPQKELIALADEFDEIYSSAYDEVKDRKLQFAQLAADKIDAQWAEMNPNAGSYEGNSLDETGIDYEPSPAEVRLFAKQKTDEYLKSQKVFKDTKYALPAIDEYILHNMQLIRSDLDPNKISGAKTAEQFREGSRLNKGIMYLYTHNTRSSFIRSQTAKDAINYCTQIPLILAVFKRYGFKGKDVPYSSWHRDELAGIVAPILREAMLYNGDELDLPKDVFIEIRNKIFSDTPKSNALTTYTIYGKKGTKVEDTPVLVAHMLLQSWACNPTNRTKYMILDPRNWDLEPEPYTKMLPQKKEHTSLFKSPKDSGGFIPW